MSECTDLNRVKGNERAVAHAGPVENGGYRLGDRPWRVPHSFTQHAEKQ